MLCLYTVKGARAAKIPSVNFNHAANCKHSFVNNIHSANPVYDDVVLPLHRLTFQRAFLYISAFHRSHLHARTHARVYARIFARRDT